MNFFFTVSGKDAWLARMQTVVATLGPRLADTMRTEMLRIADYIRARKLSGQVLNRRSGALSRSITGQSELSGYKVIGMVGSKGVPYAPIHEFGATFSREVTLAFGRPIIPVQATFHYPERAFVHPGLDENLQHVNAALRATGIEVLRAT